MEDGQGRSDGRDFVGEGGRDVRMEFQLLVALYENTRIWRG